MCPTGTVGYFSGTKRETAEKYAEFFESYVDILPFFRADYCDQNYGLNPDYEEPEPGFFCNT
jgi:hypothetical protein